MTAFLLNTQDFRMAQQKFGSVGIGIRHLSENRLVQGGIGCVSVYAHPKVPQGTMLEGSKASIEAARDRLCAGESWGVVSGEYADWIRAVREEEQ